MQMARVWLAVPLSLVLLGAGCSGGGGEPTGSSSTEEAGDVPRSVRPFADILGCDSWSDAVSDGRLASAVGYSCVVDGSQVAWVHTFDPSDRSFLVEHFEQRSPNENLDAIACADGQPPPATGPWILVGDGWVVSSYHEDRVAQVEEALGGEYAGGGGDGEAPPAGPPASFQVPDFCADG